MLSVTYQDKWYYMVSNDGEKAAIIKINHTDSRVSRRNKPIVVPIEDIQFNFRPKDRVLSESRIK